MSKSGEFARASARPLAWLVNLASVCAVGATVTLLQSVLVPFSFAAMLAAVLWPPVSLLQRRGVPRGLALGLVSTGAFVAVMISARVLVQSAEGFIDAVPAYGKQLAAVLDTWIAQGEAFGISRETLSLEGALQPEQLVSSLGGVLGGVLGGLASVASTAFMVVLLGLFLLAEGEGLSRKVTRAFGDGPTAEHLQSVGASLQSYVMLKTLTSGLTGLMVCAGLWLVSLPHAVLWGFLAFLLNYIPNIGSIIAAVPAVLLALVVGGPVTAGIVTALYLAANLIIGSILEPRIMGDQLGLSPLVILLALLLWGYMWGASGMLLSVPLTVLICEFLSISDDSRWISVLLGPNPPEEDPAEA